MVIYTNVFLITHLILPTIIAKTMSNPLYQDAHRNTF